MEMLYDNCVKGFAVTFDQFNASLLNKIDFLTKNLTDPTFFNVYF